MKSLFSILILSSFLLMPNQVALAKDKKSKKEKRMEQFTETKKLVDSKQFIFVPDRAFPQGGRSIDLTTNYGFVKIMDSETEGDMPFFGRGFSVPYGGGEGIKFDKTSIENEEIEINEKKMRLTYSFEARGDNDTYRISMDISYGGSTSVSVTSNNRSHISYNGSISKIEEDKKKD
ncbi:DUF4251 domain-containing protein [Carboxylicivirga sp. M1479]|uniref:DUF4251 domain-containing protein n=1 Tax=Carboxylicivirga sp. M1479 TaxID=2594476 RepID=UPI001177F55C|nr:DUF4251 domain-containing protein [Carboxylicivirga sp. M1479]TRX64261.1 DUF4251 domain-containing protein [Carboxylicivirga sp. M1479]